MPKNNRKDVGVVETWKDIKGYEGLYMVSDKGNIYSISAKKNIKTRLSTSGYCKINLCKCGIKKTYTVHRLVMENFEAIEGMDKLQVNHINEVRHDNQLSNLEWCTAKENINHGNHNKKIEDYRKNNGGNSKRKIMCINTGKVFNSISEGAREYGIKYKSGISKVLKGASEHCGIYNREKLRWVYF